MSKTRSKIEKQLPSIKKCFKKKMEELAKEKEVEGE